MTTTVATPDQHQQQQRVGGERRRRGEPDRPHPPGDRVQVARQPCRAHASRGAPRRAAPTAPADAGAANSTPIATGATTTPAGRRRRRPAGRWPPPGRCSAGSTGRRRRLGAARRPRRAGPVALLASRLVVAVAGARARPRVARRSAAWRLRTATPRAWPAPGRRRCELARPPVDAAGAAAASPPTRAAGAAGPVAVGRSRRRARGGGGRRGPGASVPPPFCHENATDPPSGTFRLSTPSLASRSSRRPAVGPEQPPVGVGGRHVDAAALAGRARRPGRRTGLALHAGQRRTRRRANSAAARVAAALGDAGVCVPATRGCGSRRRR